MPTYITHVGTYNVRFVFDILSRSCIMFGAINNSRHCDAVTTTAHTDRRDCDTIIIYILYNYKKKTSRHHPAPQCHTCPHMIVGQNKISNFNRETLP